MNMMLFINPDSHPLTMFAMFAVVFVLLCLAMFAYKKIRSGKAPQAESNAPDFLTNSTGIAKRKYAQDSSQDGPAGTGDSRASAPAPGRSGTMKLVRVSDREAALIMAIVAEEMNIPVNQIIFKSIICCEEEGNEI
jgi:hypothetical protein